MIIYHKEYSSHLNFEDQFSFYYNYVAESVISCIWPNVSREKQDISN